MQDDRCAFMNNLQIIFLAFAVSLPIVTLITMTRGVVCIWRIWNLARRPIVIPAFISVVFDLAVFCGAAVVWSVYALCHGPKNRLPDHFILASTGVIVYGCALATLLVSGYAESHRTEMDR